MIIIQQGDLVLTDRILTGDLLIDGDKIVAIDEHLSVPEGAEVINAKGEGNPALHNEAFTIDESILEPGITMMAAIAAEFLQEK